ncbi:MAG: dihydropteroate synthase [Planctomycetia bacterium]|nr:dihydropteroate synthase [Planctomycetia bacterium]
MSIPGLSIIGESINDSVPSTHQLYEEENYAGICELARLQSPRAAYIDVNVGSRSGAFLAQMIQKIQECTDRPLSIDTPDPQMAELGLRAYDNTNGKPLLNSISPLRTEMFSLIQVAAFRPILLISENIVEGEPVACHTAEETYAAAKFMLEKAHEVGIETSDCIFDPGIAPIGTDAEGNAKRLLDALEMMKNDPAFDGFHASVGLSNFTVMLPSRTGSGALVKSPLESAFLTLAMPLGLDYVIGSVKRDYQLLPEDHPAMRCLRDCLAVGGYDSIMRVAEFYQG